MNDAASLSENSSASSTSRGIPSTESSDTVSTVHSLQPVEGGAEDGDAVDGEGRGKQSLETRDTNV